MDPDFGSVLSDHAPRVGRGFRTAQNLPRPAKSAEPIVFTAPQSVLTRVVAAAYQLNTNGKASTRQYTVEIVYEGVKVFAGETTAVATIPSPFAIISAAIGLGKGVETGAVLQFGVIPIPEIMLQPGDTFTFANVSGNEAGDVWAAAGILTEAFDQSPEAVTQRRRDYERRRPLR